MREAGSPAIFMRFISHFLEMAFGGNLPDSGTQGGWKSHADRFGLEFVTLSIATQQRSTHIIHGATQWQQQQHNTIQGQQDGNMGGSTPALGIQTFLGHPRRRRQIRRS